MNGMNDVYYIHVFVDGELATKRLSRHLPRLGDTVRLKGEKYVIVTEVVWCDDEPCALGTRINLRLESEPVKKARRKKT